MNSLEMYPGFITSAKEENSKKAEWSFDVANKVEQIHANLFRKAIESMKDKKDLTQNRHVRLQRMRQYRRKRSTRQMPNLWRTQNSLQQNSLKSPNIFFFLFPVLFENIVATCYWI
jgi:rubrerythrin